MDHFTYSDVLDTKSLQQGDVLERTEEINALLKRIHPLYHEKKDYKYLIVVTQSCDLVRRNGGPCKARYISLVAVRPFTVALERELRRYQSDTMEADGR